MVEAVDFRPPGGPEPRAAPDAPSEPPGVLRRSRDDRMLFGVAGGLGRYLGVDPVFVRIAFAVLAVLGGSGVLLYLLGLVVIPEERPGEAVAAARPGTATGSGPAVIVGGGLVAIGAVSLVSHLVPSVRGLLGPAALVGIGVLVMLKGARR